MSKNKHGGPDRNQGRKLGPWGERRLLSIKCTDAELETIKALGTRERAEVLLKHCAPDNKKDQLCQSLSLV